jgi:hypothetical protein
MLNALVGTTKRKVFSAILLGIIGYLLYMKNKKSTTDNIKLKEESSKKKVLMFLCRKEARATSTQSSSKESRSW